MIQNEAIPEVGELLEGVQSTKGQYIPESCCVSYDMPMAKMGWECFSLHHAGMRCK